MTCWQLYSDTRILDSVLYLHSIPLRAWSGRISYITEKVNSFQTMAELLILSTNVLMWLKVSKLKALAYVVINLCTKKQHVLRLLRKCYRPWYLKFQDTRHADTALFPKNGCSINMFDLWCYYSLGYVINIISKHKIIFKKIKHTIVKSKGRKEGGSKRRKRREEVCLQKMTVPRAGERLSRWECLLVLQRTCFCFPLMAWAGYSSLQLRDDLELT